MKLFGYLDVDGKKDSVDSEEIPVDETHPHMVGESDEPVFPEFGDPAGDDDAQPNSGYESDSAADDQQSDAREFEDEQEPRPERPSLSFGELLFHPLIAWLIQTMIVGLLFVAIGVLVIIWNPEQANLKFGRLIPVAEGIILWIVAWRRLVSFRLLFGSTAGDIPGFAVAAIFVPLLVMLAILYQCGSWNMAATATVIAAGGAILSIVSLRESVRRMDVLTSGVPISGVVATDENAVNLTDLPGVLTRLEWAFDLGEITYSGSCRVPYSQELASGVAFGTAIVLYLPTNPKKSIAYVAFADSGKRR
ncbi:MAG: hypothetical protein FWD57_09685, partial [Polyangiaceae bacterium]|nr:hypothetical protein [Polyangiaceae bacterium]